MTQRATITAAAMREAIAAAKQGVRVRIKPDGETIIEPAAVQREDDDDGQSLVSMRR